MIDLAISVDDDAQGITIVETNHGDRLAAPKWPQDSDFRLVAFRPRARECDIIPPRELAEDIGFAIEMLEPMLRRKHRKPDWYRRLKRYAEGANPKVRF